MTITETCFDMTNPASLVLLATIGAPHGVKGEVRVKTFTADPEGLADYGALRSGDGRRFKIKRMRPDKTVMVVKFEGLNCREEAEEVRGVELFVERHRLPPVEEDDEFYVTDLIGLVCVDEGGAVLGTVGAVEDFGAGDVLEIERHGDRPLLVAFTRANVPHIDLVAGTVTVVLPPETGEPQPDPGAFEEEA